MKAVFLLGPTASGKTAVALALAARFPVEIVSVDSAQVYRGMDVGTAKPDARGARARVPHHLIDIVDPTEAYSAGRFRERRAAPRGGDRRRAARCRSSPGGTMLYFRALTRGPRGPSARAARDLRREIEERAARDGWPALHARARARRSGDRGAHRAHRRATHPARARGAPPLGPHAHPNCTREDAARALALRGAHASRSSPRIAPCCTGASRSASTRCSHAGLVGGAARACARAMRSRADMPSMRAVGYRQAWEVLEGRAPTGDARGARHRGHAPARQAPAHVAARDGRTWSASTACGPDLAGAAAASGWSASSTAQSSPWNLKLTLSFAR